MSLMEMMVAFGVSGIVMAALMSLSLYTARSFAAMSNYTELDKQSRFALDKLTMEIRQAGALTEYSATNLVFNIGAAGPLEYVYDGEERTLTETKGAVQTVLLEGCDALQFTIFQRNTAGGSFNQFPAMAGTNTAKVVQVSWTCSREIMGVKATTESVQTAKIVIRE